MRITNNMLINNMTYNLNSGLQRMEKLQYQTATGKKFRVPSDDPISASKSLKFNTDMSKIDQYQRNAQDAKSWMKETESALTEINEVLKRSYELTVQAANGTNAPDDLEKIKAEITELKGHLIQIGNTTYAGRSVFTGYKTDQKLLNDDGTYNVSLEKFDITKKNEDGTETILKKDQQETFVYNVGVAETVEVNTLGNKIFGIVTDGYDSENPINLGEADYKSDVEGKKGSEGDTPYLIAVFAKLEAALGNITAGEAPSQEGLQSSLTELKDSMGQILSVTAEIGAKSNRLELTTNKLADQALNLEELLSFNEDISLPEAYMKLSIEENVYRASLAVGAKVIQPSLMDFLR